MTYNNQNKTREPVKIGINGFGRIGKQVMRLTLESADMEVVQINDKMPKEMVAHLLKYDSVHGLIGNKVGLYDDGITVDGRKIRITNHNDPADIRWDETGIRCVVESSGKFKTKALLSRHLKNGVEKVILSCPPDEDEIDSVVIGINDHLADPAINLFSNSSCTSNCVAHMLEVLIDGWGVQYAFMNTVHPTTNNQNLQDGMHSDYRRARCALNNIIPTSTSAVSEMHRIFPDLKDRFDGFATRVPVPDCSFVELTAKLNKPATAEEINQAFFEYSDANRSQILEYTEDPIVSSDITNNTHSVVFDALSTKVIGGDFVQLIGWYDNEAGYSARITDHIRKMLKATNFL